MTFGGCMSTNPIGLQRHKNPRSECVFLQNVLWQV